MTDTPICAAVARDLDLDVDELIGPAAADTEPDSPAPTTPAAI